MRAAATRTGVRWGPAALAVLLVAGALGAWLAPGAARAADPGAPPLRIEALERCGDRLAAPYHYCVRVAGLSGEPAAWRLGGERLPASSVGGAPEAPRLRLDPDRHRSGPLEAEQGGRRSNAVWLSMRPAAVVAALPSEVAPNQDGVTSYVDLVSVLIEEEYDALAESRRIAEEYGAEIVGGIPALNLYQLRLPAKDLVQRDALVLRIGSEEPVDAVVVEESSPEDAERGASPAPAKRGASPAPAEGELWVANRFADAVDFYRRRIPGQRPRVVPAPIRIAVIERWLDFDAPDFAPADAPGAAAAAPAGRAGAPALRLYGRDAPDPKGHGTTVAGILAARWGDGGNTGFLRGLDGHHGGIEVIVGRGSDAGITANVATSVNLVEDGARVLNWSWGVNRVGTRTPGKDDAGTLLRSGIAMGGYEELLEAFFTWLRQRHPDVVVVNSAGNVGANSGDDDYRLPSSFVSEQLLVVGGHERSGADVPVEDPRFARRRASSSFGPRVDVTAAACTHGSAAAAGERGEVHCGTSYATALVSGLVAAMLTIDPELKPRELRLLLRRSALPIGEEADFEPVDAEDLTAPIVPSERGYDVGHPDVGHGARLDMREALRLAVDSRLRRPGEAPREE